MLHKMLTVLLGGMLMAVSVSAEIVDLGNVADPVRVNVLESNDSRTVIRFDLGAFERNLIDIDGQPYFQLTAGDEGVLRERGNPAVPRVCRSIIIPDDAEMKVNILDAEYVDYEETPVAPSKGSILRTVDPKLVKYEFSDVYNRDGFFPGAAAQLREPFIQRDYRGTVVEIYPFHYNPASRTLRVYKSVILEVVNVGPGQINVLTADKKKSARVGDFETIYKRRFINYDFQSKVYPDVPETGDMLIITYASFNATVAPLAEWKKQKGIKTTVVNVSTIGNNYTSIYNFIDAFYDSTNLAWVLLVGDAAQVATGSSGGGGADPKYALVSGTDSYPDLFIGRFSAENTTQVQTQVDRTITYERDHPGSGWYTRGTGIASAEGPGHFGEYDITHMNYIRNDLLAYNYTLVDQIYDPGATASAVSAAVNAGRGIINYIGHGSTTAWSTTGFSNTHVNALTNNNMLPFIHSVACVNGNFTSSTCFGEAWLRATNGSSPSGAIGAYMSSINQYWDEPMDSQDEYIDLLCAEAKTTYGGLCFHGSSRMIEINGSSGIDMYNTWHIFGDPSLQVRSLDPQTITVDHPGTVFFVADEYTVDVGVEGALCALYGDGVLYGSAYSGSNGIAVIPIVQELPVADDILLTVTGYNLVTVIDTVTTTSDLAIIHRNPLQDTKDTLNAYRVDCEIYTSAPLNEDELLLKYEVNSVWTSVVLSEGLTQGTYYGMIPAQPAGTEVSYYLYATNTADFVDSTDTFTFKVIDYGLILAPAFATQAAPVYDTVWYNMAVTNDGVLADVYDLTFSGNSWVTALFDETGTFEITATSSLNGNDEFEFRLRVIIPESWEDDFDSITVTATSQGDASYFATAAIKTVSAGQPLPIPFSDDFPSTTFDIHKWESTSGVTITTQGLNIPTPPYCLNFDGAPSAGDQLVSEKINLRDKTGCMVRFKYERTGPADSPETGDDLVVEYLDALGVWHEIGRLYGSGPDMTEFEQVEIYLPVEAHHAEFRVRMYNIASSGDFDDWFVDDIYVGYPPDFELMVSPYAQTQYGASGEQIAYQIKIINRGRLDDSYDLAATGNAWDAAFYDETGVSEITSTGLIAAGDSASVVVKVDIPPTSIMHNEDNAVLVVSSQGDPLVSYDVGIKSISAGPAGEFPWADLFEELTLGAPRWLINKGATVSTDGINPPSPPYALNLDGGCDTLVSQIINLSAAGGATIAYYYQCGGGGATPGIGDNLVLEYKNAYGAWVNLNTHAGAQGDMNTFERVSFGLPLDAIHANFQIRLISSGAGENLDDWFIDNIRLDYAPNMSVTPTGLNHWLLVGQSADDDLIISNAGPGTLEYWLKTMPVFNRGFNYDLLNSLGDVEPARREYSEEFLAYDDVKGGDDPRQGHPVTRDAGGPDQFGYFWVDSDAPGGPTFDWIDISSSGIDITAGLKDDNYIGPFELGFEFPYYGLTYDKIYVASNGMIGFDSTGLKTRLKKPIPTDSVPNNMICWLWDDLNPVDADVPEARVYMDTTGGQCVIMFHNYPEYGAMAGDVINAEVILMPDGSIKIQYLDFASGFDAASATIGIENADGTDGLEVAYLTNYVHANLALQFYCPSQWLTLDVTDGFVAPGEADTIQYHISTEGLDTGVYVTNVCITSNDPTPGKSSYLLTAQLTVGTEPPWICGDADDSGDINLLDVLVIIEYVYNEGQEPANFEAADVDGSGGLNLLDVLTLIDFIYNEGPEPTCP